MSARTNVPVGTARTSSPYVHPQFKPKIMFWIGKMFSFFCGEYQSNLEPFV